MGLCSTKYDGVYPINYPATWNTDPRSGTKWLQNVNRRNDAVSRVPRHLMNKVTYDSTVGQYKDRNGKWY